MWKNDGSPRPVDAAEKNCQHKGIVILFFYRFIIVFDG